MPPQSAPRELIPAIGYIRVSMLLEEQISPDIQRNAITDWARRNGRRIVGWVEDLDESGRTFARKIMQAIEAVEAGEAREIVVWKFSRFGRTRTGNAVNLGRINLAGGELQSATEEVDARTAVGRLTRGMLMELASFESDRTGEQWAEAHENRRARGLPSHGRPRFGYILRGRVRDPLQPYRTIRDPSDGAERYEIDPVTGPILAEVYARYTSGDGTKKLAGWLNGEGLRGTRGLPWSHSTILQMMDAGFGAGLLRVHDVNCTCPSPGKCRNKILIPGAHDPVITQAEWQAYRRRRVRVGITPPRARASIYPLSGRIWCGHCGARMTVVGKTGHTAYAYRCGNWIKTMACAPREIRRVLAEEKVLAELAAWADYIEAKAPVRPADAVEGKNDKVKLEGEIRAADTALDRLTMQLARDVIPEDSYKRSRDNLLEERAKAAAQLERLDVPAPMGRHEYLPVIRALVEEWTTLRAGERREMMAELVPEVRVFRESRTSAWMVIRSAWGEERTVQL